MYYKNKSKQERQLTFCEIYFGLRYICLLGKMNSQLQSIPIWQFTNGSIHLLAYYLFHSLQDFGRARFLFLPNLSTPTIGRTLWLNVIVVLIGSLPPRTSAPVGRAKESTKVTGPIANNVIRVLKRALDRVLSAVTRSEVQMRGYASAVYISTLTPFSLSVDDICI